MVYLKRLLLAAALAVAAVPAAAQQLGLVPSDRILCRDTAGPGQVEFCTLTEGLGFDGSRNITNTLSGDVTGPGDDNELDAAAVKSKLEAVLEVENLQGYSAVLTETEAVAIYQPLDADLTAIAALVTTAAGRSVLTYADPNTDAILGWDDSAGAIESLSVSEVLAIIEATTPILTEAEAVAQYQPLDADLTAIAALTTTAAGRTSLTFADPNQDRPMIWDDNTNTVIPGSAASIATEATPASGDFLLMLDAGDVLRKVDWADLPGAGGGASDFLALTDTPSAYTTFAGDCVAVNGTEDGLEFVTCGAGGGISAVVDDTSPQLGGPLDTNGFGIELGNGHTDTTLTRSSAGVAAIEGVDLLSTTAAAAAYQPLDADLTSWAGVTRASGFDTFAATASSANLRSLLTDEVGTGAAYFVGGALGTPASATLTNATGLPVSGITASTSTAIGVGSVELGHASDTTLTRSAAGVVAVEGIPLARVAGTPSNNNFLSWFDGVLEDSSIGIADLVLQSDKATQAQAEAGTNNTRWMTPLRTAEAIAALGGGGGGTTFASASEYRTGTEAAKALAPDQVWAAADTVALTDAATIAIDFSTGFNFSVTMGGNRTLGNPTNVKPGQTGVIRATASGANRTLNKAANWKSVGVTWPVTVVNGNSVYVFYYAFDSTNIIVTGVLNNPA